VVACLSVAYPAWAALEYPTHLLQSLPTLAAMVAVGASPRPLWWRALALLCPLEMLAGAATGIWDVDLLKIGYVAIVFVSGWVLGVVLAARRSYTRALEEKTAALEAARQELAHRAVLEERTRIARDLHDILAHAMSVITVQAGVGGHLLERDPEQAKGALRVIEETGRGALGEMRRLLGVLRGGDLPTEPQPGLGSLDRRWPPRPPRPGCRWSCRSRARPGRCRPGWRCRPTGSPRRRSPTPSSTRPAAGPG
jgi:signal transduction histidine kinase